MAARRTLTVTYALSPPEGVTTPTLLAPNDVHAFAIEAEKTDDVRKYYDAVQKAITAAREKLGEELTAWRDAVGNAESGKENAMKAAREEDEEEEEQE